MSEAAKNPGPPVAPEGLRVTRPRKGAITRDEAERALEALRRGSWLGEGRYAKVENDDFTYLGELEYDGRTLLAALKQIVAKPGLLGALRALSPRRRARRQWRGAERIESLGIPTGAPVLLATGRLGRRRCDWLVLRHVPGTDLLNHLALEDLSVAEEHDAARRVGKLVATIDGYGWFNRDTKLSNLIRLPTGEIAAIDTVDIQRRPGRRVRMLRAMLAEAMGHDVLPRRTILMRALKEAVEEPREAWRELERFARRRGDRTRPRVNVLRERIPAMPPLK